MKLAIPAQMRKKVTLADIPDGVGGIKATLSVMVKLAQQGKSDFRIRTQALQLVSSLTAKDYLGEVEAIQQYVRDNIRYVRDINDIETLSTPVQTIQQGQGDCDDKSLLTAALLESIGHPSRFVAVGRQMGVFCHVLVETKIGKNWIPVETTEPVPVGWYPPGMTQRLVYNI